jgi:hypothetical protein
MEEANFNVEHVPTNSVWEHWEYIEQYVAEAAEATYGECSKEYYREQLIKGIDQLLLFKLDDKIIGCMTITVDVAPTGKRYLELPCLGGDHNILSEYKKEIVDHIRMLKTMYMCDVARGGGRKGWHRFLRDEGFKPTQTFVEL